MSAPRSGNPGIAELKRVIRNRYPGLPGNQRKVADFFLQHAQEIPFLSVVEIERRSGASKATVVRLAQSLGYSGFLKLRAALREGAQTALQESGVFPIPPRRGARATLRSVAEQDIQNIAQTIDNLDEAVFADIGRRLVRASTVYTLGLGISALMARVMAYSLNQVAVRAVPFEHDHETFFEQLPFLNSHDVVIAFSFPPYSRETVDAVRIAADRSVPVIGITDRETSPISFACTHVLPIRSTNMLFTNSISAISVVINALVTEVALHNRSRALRMQRDVDRVLRRTGHFVPDV